jgi:hypothetical protein
MSYTITKVSGVVFVRDSRNSYPKSYFNATGKFQAADSDTTVLLSISDQAGQVPDQYTLTLGSVTVGTSTPSTMSSLLVLLNSILGS